MRSVISRAAVGAMLLAGCATPTPDPVPPAPTVIAGSFTAERQPDGNSVIFEDESRLILVDTGRHLDHQQKIIDHARARGKPIDVIVNTHWHLDHSGGNAEIRAAYPAARIHSSNAIAGALDGFLARGLARNRARLADPGISEAEKAEARLGIEAVEDRANLLPDVPVTGPAVLPLGGRNLELRLAARAATEGDVWLYDPATRTLVAGDLVVVPAPFFDTACPEGWQRALSELAAVPFVTLIPGHGAPMSHAEFGIWRAAFDSLVACGRGDADKQLCIDGWLRDARTFLVREQDREDARMLLDYYVDEILRSPEKRAEFCGD